MRSTWGESPLQPKGFYRIPVVRAVLLAEVAVFLLYFFLQPLREDLARGLLFRHPGGASWDWLGRPWTLLSYPFLITDLISLLLSCYWFYLCGGVLERSWGSVNFAAILAAFTLLGSLGLLAGSILLNLATGAGGLFLLGSACLVAWAAMDPDLELAVWGVVRIPLKFLALADVLLVYFNYGFRQDPWGPVFGLFSLLSLAFAWYYVRRLPRLNLSLGVPARRPAARAPRAARAETRGWSREQVRSTDARSRRRAQEEIAVLKKLLGEEDD